MDRLTKQIIKCKVMQYPYLRNKIADEIADVCEKGASGGVNGGYSSARKSIGFDERLARLMSREDYLWCEAIESAVKHFNERGRNEVIKAVDELYWKCELNADGVARVLYMSRRKLFYNIKEFFDALHKYAIKQGIIDTE